MDLGLAGRRAVVTGGSKGIGKAIAAELIAEGAAVVICSRHQDELDAAAVELVKQMPDGSAGFGRGGGAGASMVRAMPCDVTEPQQVAGFIEAAAAAMGGLDILVNNAGGARPGQFGTLTDDDWHTDIDTKLLSQIRCTRAALPHLRRSKAPRVININAVYGRYPDPAFLASSVNRASCLSLSKALSIELGRRGASRQVRPAGRGCRARRIPGKRARQLYRRSVDRRERRHGKVSVGAGGHMCRLLGYCARGETALA